MKRRVISLWLPRLATNRLRNRKQSAALQSGQAPLRRGYEDQSPLIVVTETGDRFLVVALNYEAEKAGLIVGMTLPDARAVFPAVTVAFADPTADAALLDRLVAWCGRYTPWAAAEGGDGIFLDVTGCAHLFGGEAAMCADLMARLENFGYVTRTALADTLGAAWALSHFGKSGTVVSSGEMGDTLSCLPVAALRLDPGTVSDLAQVGVRTIGALHNMSRASLAARFGDVVGQRLDQAFGHIREPISPRTPVVQFRARLAFAEPIALITDIERGVQHLLDDLCRKLIEAGQGGRQLLLILYRVDGEVFKTVVGAARPTCDPTRLARLFSGRLCGFEPAFGVDVMTLTASVTEPMTSVTPAMRHILPPNQAICSDGLAPLIDCLGNRLGFDQVVRLTAIESHLPERMVKATSALDDTAIFAWPLSPSRPLRLLGWPERIEAILPEQDPQASPLSFQWRRTDHEIRLSEGPERIAPEWWVEGDPTRTWDYWRVEDTMGRQFWICRHGLLRPGESPEWFMHGLFV